MRGVVGQHTRVRCASSHRGRCADGTRSLQSHVGPGTRVDFTPDPEKHPRTPPHEPADLLFLVNKLLLLPALWVPVALAAAAMVDTQEETVVKWTQLRVEAARLESEWQWQRPVLSATQEALQQKVRELEAERDLLRSTSELTAADLQHREAENAGRRAALVALESDFVALSERMRQLHARLPPRLAAAVALPLQSVANPKLPLSERVQHLAAIESRCAQFNRVITLSEEELVVPGETQPRLYEVLYWGLAAAYALDRDGNRALLGTPGVDGWSWQPQPDLADRLVVLLSIHRDEAPPAFVDLPIQVKDVARAAR